MAFSRSDGIVRHWVMRNASGMHHVAEACAKAERRLGVDSEIVDIGDRQSWIGAEAADIHVLHTDVPEEFRAGLTKPYKLVFVPHGTPDHVMDITIEQHAHPGYGQPDGWGGLRDHLNHADAVVTFWDRHRWLYQSMVSPERKIHCVPLGVDVAWWQDAQPTKDGRFAGLPSVWMSENQHRIKWAYDIIAAWADVRVSCPRARLHMHYIPSPLHRFFFDFANSNGSGVKMFMSGSSWTHEQLRQMWKNVDFFLSPVRYGDFNTLFMQAAACGLKTISYRNNPYADFWINEGDQRQIAMELAVILKGEVAPRADKWPVPTLEQMGEGLLGVYDTLFPDPPLPPAEPVCLTKPSKRRKRQATLREVLRREIRLMAKEQSSSRNTTSPSSKGRTKAHLKRSHARPRGRTTKSRSGGTSTASSTRRPRSKKVR